jgi:hypothetical protein
MDSAHKISLQERVGNYLSDKALRKNSFVASTEAAEAAQAAAEVEEAQMDEYLLRRAEQELETAQNKVNAIKRKIEASDLASISEESD